MRLVDLPAWRALSAHAVEMRTRHLRQLFSEDAKRFERFSLSFEGGVFDYSKQRITQDTLNLLIDLLAETGVEDWLQRLFAGEPVNLSEHRAALHMALRYRGSSPIYLNGVDVMPGVHEVRLAIRNFCHAFESGRVLGYDGMPIRDVVNIGIGGSDLGPRMASEALSAIRRSTVRVHYVSNVDGADLLSTLETLDPRTTLFVIASKTFTTVETMTNASTARAWLLNAAQNAGVSAAHVLAGQLVAVTARPDQAQAFGVHPTRVFAFWDWVGGRFSVWGAVGLPLALAIGMDAFEAFLDGAYAMDRHFRTAPPRENLPFLMALVGLWNINFLEAGNLSISPYSHSLRLLPDYLQQLEMESNGKSQRRDGLPVGVPTAPVLWGGAGSNTQHAYFQLLHQGQRLIPSDFIAFAEADYPAAGHHERLLANCLAQSATLAFGSEPTDALRYCPGNQPSSTWLLPSLSPYTLGQLLAAYEHKVCVQAAVWGVNPFDQWGVELGKQVAKSLLPALQDQGVALVHDSSTTGLLTYCRQQRVKR